CVLTCAISWMGALLVALPGLIRAQSISNTTRILMFPAMLFGPSLAGIVLTRVLDGNAGLSDLFCRMRTARVGVRWYALLLLPPLLVRVTLALMSRMVSPSFSPNHFYPGILFGVPAGFLEEIGWTGFAFPRMQSRYGFLPAAACLGVVWGTWHLPVINYVGAATPHGAYWLPFFLAFLVVMTAMRVLISWESLNTNSVLLAHLLHMTSTGALVVFSPSVAPAQEAIWYATYGWVLWMVVGVLAAAG